MTAPQPVDVHVHVHIHSGSDDKLDEILTAVQELQTKGSTMAADLSGIRTEVEEANTISASAVALLNGFGAQLDELTAQAEDGRVDVAAIQSLRDQLSSSNDSLAAAIVANTPEANPGTGTPGQPPVEQPPAPPVDGGDNV